MALIKCAECGKEISDKAISCPYCGCPVAETEKVMKNTDVREEDLGEKPEETHLEQSTTKREKRLSKRGVIAIIIAVVIIAISAIACYVLTSDLRNYNTAKELFEEESFHEALDKFVELGDYKDSAKMVEKCEYELSVDGQFLRSLSKGLMARWAESDAQAAQGNIGEDPNIYNTYCEIELEYIEDFANQSFEDSKLKEYADQYIDCLRRAQEATTYYTIDYATFSSQWSEVYSKRTILLKRFVDEYDLSVTQEYQDTLDDLMVDAVAAQEQENVKDSIKKMTEAFKIETIQDEWGYKTYKIFMNNSTDRTFEYFSAEIILYDNNQVIVGTGNTDQLSSWKPGQEAAVSAWFDGQIDPNDYTIEYVPHYQSGTYYS